MGVVIVIPADKALGIRSRHTDERPQVPELQALVGGYIEAVPQWVDYIGTPCVVYCNEEGKLDELPVNIRATALWWKARGRPADDVLVGDIVLVVGLPDKEGNDE